MPLWSRRSVLATGSWLVLALAPLATAAPPQTLDAAAGPLDPLQQRSAEERWQRLKNQYPVGGSVRTERPATRPEEPLRRIPDDDEPAALPGPSEAVPEVAIEAVPAARAGAPADIGSDDLPFPLLPSEPVWILTVTPPDDDVPEIPSAIQKSAAPKPVVAEPPAVERPAEPGTARLAELQPAPAEAAARRAESAPDAPPVQQLRIKTIREIRVGSITEPDTELRQYARYQAKERYKIPVEFGEQEFVARNFAPTAALFEAPDLSYYPLYFQDPALERYGHTYHPLVQPAVSVARFGTQLVGLPYQMVIDPPFCLETGLGWLDPGDCNPKLHYQIPWNARAAAVEAGVITGLIFLIP